MSRRNGKKQHGQTPTRAGGQEPQSGFLKKMVGMAVAAFASLFNSAIGKQIDVQYAVGITCNNVAGVRIMQVTGTVKNVAAYLKAKFGNNASALLSFGAKKWSEIPLAHAIAIEGPNTRAAGLRRSIAKAFASTQFDNAYAYYNLTAAVDEATYVVNGMQELGNAVNNGFAISKALVGFIFGENGCVRGANATALTLIGPDTPRATFAFSGNTAITLPEAFDVTQKSSCNMVGTRAFAVVERGTNQIYWLTASDIYALLADPDSQITWKTDQLNVDGTIEDISLPVTISGIQAPRLIATMTDGGQYSHVPLDVQINNGNLTFTANTRQATKATEQTQQFGSIQAADNQVGITGVDRNGGQDAVYHQPWASLPVEVQQLVDGNFDIDQLIAAQRSGQGINSLLELPAVFQNVGATTSRGTATRQTTSSPS